MPEDLSEYIPEQTHKANKPNEGVVKLLDFRLPLAWLISSAVMVSVSLGGLYMEVSDVSKQLTLIEAANDTRDTKLTNILQDLATASGKSDTEQVEITADETSIANINSEITDIQKNIKWMPH